MEKDEREGYLYGTGRRTKNQARMFKQVLKWGHMHPKRGAEHGG
ncbi:MAG: hypothetical protein Q7U60_01850 [Candidatus Methanoperedens sp.]|nr:hypothetical protein [Candidatus Methanoperedens sp.]